MDLCKQSFQLPYRLSSDREVWLVEVTHLLAPSTQYMVDMEALYTKILDDILDAQEPNGLVPTMAPEIRYMCGPLHDTITWGCALIFIPDILRRYYGCTHTIPKMYRAGEQYMQYMKLKERKGGFDRTWPRRLGPRNCSRKCPGQH